METVINDATAAENRPVYTNEMKSWQDLKKIVTYKDKDPFGLRFPAFNQLLVIFGRHFQIH